VRRTFRTLLERSERSAQSWSVVWAAGGALPSGTRELFENELAQFRVALSVMTEEIEVARTRGTMFYSSSGGAVYAGSSQPPFTEASTPVPISPYGWHKLAMEEAVKEFAKSSGTAVMAGRITNLYGPGQSVDKLQGLISHLALARFGTRSASIFVPLETVRDYLYVDDCAAVILDALDRLRSEAESSAVVAVTKIIGSGTGVTISTLLGYARALTKAPLRVAFGSTPNTKNQAVDLRMRSVVWPELDRREYTPLAAGFHATTLDVLRILEA
jgi:UDP-glucose 4-epimerase